MTLLPTVWAGFCATEAYAGAKQTNMLTGSCPSDLAENRGSWGAGVSVMSWCPPWPPARGDTLHCWRCMLLSPHLQVCTLGWAVGGPQVVEGSCVLPVEAPRVALELQHVYSMLFF